jgi:phage FluMu protein Com
MIPSLNQERRCLCGQLLAVLEQDGIEIKCRRCKRFEKISLPALLQIFKDKEPLSSDPSGQAMGTPCRCHHKERTE